ncbi:hypothetical protein PAXRUDRAFT_40387, partial [Paxillus rubicundulus Ve08.2h10]
DYGRAKNEGQTVNGKWQMANGEGKTSGKDHCKVNGEWKMEKGEWHGERQTGKWQMAS